MELSVSNRKLFFISLATVEIPGLLSVFLMAHWKLTYKGGFAWTWDLENLSKSFNWHPLLLTVGLVYLYGNGALVYRIFPSNNETHKLKIKLLHALTMTVSLVLTVVGLHAAFNSHNFKTVKNEKTQQIVAAPIPNMYTLHSWVGLLAVLLFTVQGVVGFLGFLFPKFRPEIRAFLLPIHQYFGSAIFAMAVAAALLGLLEKTIWSIGKIYKEKGSEACLVNTLGLMLVLFAAGVAFLLSKFKNEKKIKPSHIIELYTPYPNNQIY